MIEMTNLEVLKNIISNNKDISSLNFFEFSGYGLLQDRIDINGELKTSYLSALTIREKYHLPFWDSFNLSLFEKKIKDFTFLDEIKFHNIPTEEFLINRENFLNEEIYFENYTALCSKTNLERLHIPLLDFHIPVSKENQMICANILSKLSLKGYLFDSGKSYHFIGKETINENDLFEKLYYALLYSPIIDKSWIAHQLIQKFCCLRVSSKYGRLPILVQEI